MSCSPPGLVWVFFESRLHSVSTLKPNVNAGGCKAGEAATVIGRAGGARKEGFIIGPTAGEERVDRQGLLESKQRSTLGALDVWNAAIWRIVTG